MWEAFLKKYHPARGALLSKRSLDESSYFDLGSPEEVPFKLEYVEGPMGRLRALSEGSVNSSTKYYFHSIEVPITVNRELRSPKDGGSSRHIEIDIKDTSIKVSQSANAVTATNKITDHLLFVCAGSCPHSISRPTTWPSSLKIAVLL